MRYRTTLLLLVLLVLLVEALPLFIVWHSHGVWLLNNFEDFDWSFWPPLKAAYHPSYYFHESGLVYGSLGKLAHSVTAWFVGSKQFSIEYCQTFGYVTRALFILAKLGAVGVYFWWRRKRFSAALAALLLIAIDLAAPSIFDIYGLRLGFPLSYQVLTLVIALLTLDATERLAAGEDYSPRLVLAWSAVAGLTFLEAPHYILLAVPLFWASASFEFSWRHIYRQILLWATGGAGGFCLGLFAFYGTDWRSALAAVVSMLKGLGSGFAQPQPGFEQFTRMIFHPQSDYFYIHVVLALQVTALLVFGITVFRARRQLSATARRQAAGLIGSFLTVCLAHLLIWRTHGSYTTVFSLVYFNLMICTVAAFSLAGLKHAVLTHWHRFASVLAIGMLGLVAPCLLTLWATDFRKLHFYQNGGGMAFRTLNEMVGRLPKPVGLVINSDLTYYLLGAHCNLAGYLHHRGPGWHGEDARYSSKIRQERFPHYDLFYPERATAVWYDFENLGMATTVESGLNGQAPAAVFVPLSREIGNRCEIMAAAETHFVTTNSLPSDIDPWRYLLTTPGHGIRWDSPATRWSLAVMSNDALVRKIVEQYWPAVWARDNRRFYLLTTPDGYFLLGLEQTHPST